MANITIEQLASIFNNASHEVVSNMQQAVNEVAEDLLSASQKLAPLDEGGLMENGSIDPANQQGNNIVSRVGYSKEYSLRMHEDYYNLGTTSSQKPNFDGMRVGRKYLEQPTIKYGDKYSKHIADKVNGVFE